jgi:4,5-dihydroxyphthalate decarboxylase
MSAPLRTAFWNYDRTLALIDGRVEVEGHQLAIEVLRPEITFAKAFSEAAFDVCEISFSNTVTAVSKQHFPYALIPVFLSRAFRHSAIFVRTDRGIGRPEDLRGKTIGLQEYDMTAAVVVRGFLRDQYGVEPRDIAWKVGELERTKPLEFPLGRPPEGVSIEVLPPDMGLEDRLLEGQLDAIITLRPPGTWRAGDPRIAPLFADPIAAEKAWFAATGHFPIMHAVGVRKTLLDSHPGLGRRLFDAFDRAKSIAVAELEITQAPKVTLPWPHGALADARALFGPDHWPYGLRANRRVLETQLRWSRLDGLQARRVTLEELFTRDCFET